MKIQQRLSPLWSSAILQCLAAGLVGVLVSGNVQALPSFTRQTGSACNVCHINSFGPSLTPYGREFKLNGYVWGDSETWIPPISGQVLGSFTNTQKNQDAGPGYGNNNNAVFDGGSLFYAGRIWGKVGAWSELAYDGYADRVSLQGTDVRFANQVEFAGQDLVYGVSANTSPTITDLWNTTPNWGYPFVSSPYAATPAAGTIIESFGPQAGGGTIYSMINGMVYVEAGAYTTFAKNFQQGTGIWTPDQNRIDGGAPYWRVALQHDFGGHYVSIGHFGMRADVFTGGVRDFGTDRYTDLAADATYQYLGNLDHIVEVRGTYIRENQELFAQLRSGASPFSNNQLNSFKINGTYTFQQTYSLSFAYNRITATANTGLYNTTGGFAASGRPDSEFFTVEFDYVPFGKDNSLAASLMNLRLGVQYIGYNQFNGTSHHAGDNNTLLLNGWLAF